MAAVTYKFGVESQIDALDSASGALTPEQAEEDGGLVGLSGLGYTEHDLGVDFVGPLTSDVVNATHSGLQNMAWLRRVVEEALQGRTFRVVFSGRKALLELDEPVPVMPAWNPPTTATLRRFSVLSWTSKMGAPSFSLPAGAPVMGGACPGAAAGQTIVPQETLQSSASELVRLTQRPVRLAQAICQHCYAERGQYSTGNVQFAQVLRYAWTRQAVADGSFITVMDWAVRNANYHLEGKGYEKVETTDEDGNPVTEKIPVPGERDGSKYFRLHDSGDFWSPEYIAAWKAVADANPEVMFWAPSRVWINDALREAVNLINSPPRNLVIRPSSYHVNEPPPRDLGAGWAAGSTSYKDVLKPTGPRVLGEDRPYDWDCQAYAADSDKVTCRGAMDPDRRTGCRACWLHGLPNRDEPEGLEVNYTLH